MKRRKWLRRALKALAWGAAVFVTSTVLLVAGLRFVNPPTSAFIVERKLWASRHGEAVAVRRTWVPLSSISGELRLAVIASEDQKFPTHFGFDVDAIADAVEERLEGKSLRGASTLSQQVAKNLFLWSGKSLLRKGLEAYFTVLLETFWSKRRILEVHLNVAEWGNGLYGAEAAAQAYFGKSASQLSAEESAALAACLPSPRTRSPVAMSPVVETRAAWVLDQAPRLKVGGGAPLAELLVN